MNIMNFKRYRLLLLLLVAVLASGCVGSRMGVSWPSVGTIDLHGEESIAVAYNDRIAILSPSNGAAARLLNPVSGEVRLDQDNNPRTWALLGGEHENGQFYATPIWVDEETYLVADHNGFLLEVDAFVVSVNNRIALGDQVVADMLAVDGVLYIPLQNNGLMAMSIDGYQKLWTFTADSGVWAKPLLVGELIVFGSVDHFLYAVDRATGQLEWAVDLGGSVASTPLLANDRLYVGSFNKAFFEISLDGQILNQYETENWVWGKPAMDADGIVYIADLSGYVHALDTERGLDEVWSVQIAERGIRPGPLVYEYEDAGRVIVASRDGKVYWIDSRDGQLINAREVEGRPELLGNLLLLEPSESLDIDEPLIIVSSVDLGKLLIAFGVDGRQTWVYRL